MAVAVICNMVAAIPPQSMFFKQALMPSIFFWGVVLVFIFSLMSLSWQNRSKTSLCAQNGYGVKLRNDPNEDWWYQGLLEHCGGMAATILHITAITILHAHSVCILLAHCSYCISKLHVHDMHIAAIAILSVTLLLLVQWVTQL